MSIFEADFNTEDYFQNSMQFLHDYKWIFSSSNTKFLKDNVFQRFPCEWKQYFITVDNDNLNSFPEGLNSTDGVPETLQQFQDKLKLLKPKVNLPSIESRGRLMKGMSPKKAHEIMQLSKLIVDKMGDNVSLLIDFGSGLGYLSEVLNKSNKFRILGLECDPQRVDLAKRRQKDYYPGSISNIIYETMTITQCSAVQIECLCRENFPDAGQGGEAIIGLHACGDLSITAMNIFLESNNIRKLVIMPCCYHKLALSEDPGNMRIFKHFPLSACLQRIVKSSPNGWKILNRPFLRLACQQTVSRWRSMRRTDHETHGWKMFVRAIAECLTKDNEKISRIRRAKGTQIGNVFPYLSEQYHIVSIEQNALVNLTQEHKRQVDELYAENANGDKISEGLTCLQTALQELCERIVLMDRICYIQEKASEMGIRIQVDVKKILNDELSPRCYAFIAEK